MKTIEEQDHYEVLEVSHSARLDDIRRAYPMVRAAYEDGSLATYSVFGTSEAASIRERIDLAYRVLTDAESRRAYDVELGIDSGSYVQLEEEAVAVDTAVPPAVEVVSALDALDDLDELEDEDGDDWDGSKLRRARMRRGIEIDAISDITRINPNYLRGIEEDAYTELPAPVYTRGFVTAYARTIGVDPHKVASSFMARFEDARGEHRRGSLFGRRESR
ncbi:MAG: helix-turn-helix domain-containing protein [Myxococcota bacterium]|nr:helix-turn-helix domain-containing protein [Myxococcota bacterium]